MKEHTACFTGHRPMFFEFEHNQNDPHCKRIRERMRAIVIDLIDNYDIKHFLSGMADGVDRWAADIIIDLKKGFPDITLECAIPYEKQIEEWREEDRAHYKYILENSDKVTFVGREFTKDCFVNRDHYMVNHSECVIAIWNGVPSGTGDTIAYAQDTETKIIYIKMD